ncbi:MAG: AhpC/TSA family protein [Cyclobacteriaceae bacterium]|nr:AhpC/TSA family protein [Cyclobacteriaceae bacterium]
MKRLILIAGALFVCIRCAQAFVRCKLQGEVKGIETEAIWLKKVSENMHVVVDNRQRRIPVKHGVFEYEFIADEVEAYEFVFDEDLGSTWGLVFFPDDGLIRMVIQRSGTRTKLICEGGKQNDEYEDYVASLAQPFAKREDQLMRLQELLLERDEVESEAFKATRGELKRAGEDEERRALVFRKRDELEKTGRRYSDKGAEFMRSYDSLMAVKTQWTYDYVMKNKTLVCYFLLYNMTRFAKPGSAELALASQAYPLFETKYPQHTYTEILRDLLAGLNFVAPGYKYIDVQARKLDGKTVMLSTVLNGKVNLINLWGSWCGPCIAKSRKIVPLFNKYKNKGFVVVGVAREFKDLKALRSRLSKEQFSWLNLVELDDEYGVWNKYVIANGAGLLVLTDDAGLILSIDPSPEEIERVIKEKLQNDTKN